MSTAELSAYVFISFKKSAFLFFLIVWWMFSSKRDKRDLSSVASFAIFNTLLKHFLFVFILIIRFEHANIVLFSSLSSKIYKRQAMRNIITSSQLTQHFYGVFLIYRLTIIILCILYFFANMVIYNECICENVMVNFFASGYNNGGRYKCITRTSISYVDKIKIKWFCDLWLFFLFLLLFYFWLEKRNMKNIHK